MTSTTIPTSWCLSNLIDAISIAGLISDGDWIETKDQNPEGEVRIIQLADIGDSCFRDKSQRFMTSESATKLNCTYLNTGDVLIARMPDPLGRACIFPKINQKSVTVVDICLIRTKDSSALGNILLQHWINSPQIRSIIASQASGTTRKRITRKKLSLIEFHIPPLAEQKQIATQLDNLLAQVDTLKNRLDAISTHLKRFRQTVLAAAVSGKLTEDWRVDQKQKSQDLDQIKKHWELEHIKNNKKYQKPKIRAKNTIHDNVLPSTWLKTQIGYVFDVHIGSTPKRSNPEFWEGDIHWVSSSEVAFCTIENTKENITELGLKSSSTRVHPIGTVMLAMIGQGKTRGQAAILGVEACHNQNTAALRVSPKHTESKFLYYYLVKQYEETRQIGGGNNQKALNKSTVISLNFPLPPLEEQTEIVTRIESLFAFADKIDQCLKQAQEQAKNLTPSLLAKAFRGDLTAEWRKQNSDLITGENSAESLLARIKAEQEKLKPKRKTRKRKT